MITGDFVTTEDGTGIVHIAPTFGADDDRVAKQTGISPLIVEDADGKTQALVDRKGRFFRIAEMEESFVEKYVNTDKYRDFSGRYVKNEYDEKLTEADPTVDVETAGKTEHDRHFSGHRRDHPRINRRQFVFAVVVKADIVPPNQKVPSR